MITRLPVEVITRIFIELINDSCQLQFTCKGLYRLHQILRFKLRPITVTSEARFQWLLSNPMAAKLVTFMNIKQGRYLAIMAFQGFGTFQNLKVLNLLVNSVLVLGVFCDLPKSLTKLSIFINYNNGCSSKKNLMLIEDKLDKMSLNTTSSLKTLELSTNSSMLSTKVNNYLLLWLAVSRNQHNQNVRLSHVSHRYFESETVRRIEDFKRTLFKQGPVLFGNLVLKCLYTVRSSLSLLQLNNVDASLIFLPTQNHLNWNFPHLKLFVFDNCSVNRMNTWFEKFKLTNQHQNDDKPLFFILKDNLSGRMLTKTALSHDNNWSNCQYSDMELYKIKRQLGVE